MFFVLTFILFSPKNVKNWQPFCLFHWTETNSAITWMDGWKQNGSKCYWIKKLIEHFHIPYVIQHLVNHLGVQLCILSQTCEFVNKTTDIRLYLDLNSFYSLKRVSFKLSHSYNLCINTSWCDLLNM